MHAHVMEVVVRAGWAPTSSRLWTASRSSRRDHGLTRIVGPVPDQSKLFGLLDMFDGLHIEVVSVNPVGAETP